MFHVRLSPHQRAFVGHAIAARKAITGSMIQRGKARTYDLALWVRFRYDLKLRRYTGHGSLRSVQGFRGGAKSSRC